MSPCAFSPSSRRSKTAEPVLPLSSPATSFPDVGGNVIRRRSIGPFTVGEYSYSGPSTLAARTHREALITFVIEGTLREKYATTSVVCRPGGVRFLPPGVQYVAEADAALRCLHVSSAADALEQLVRQSVVPKKPSQINGLATTWLGNRLYAEFTREDAASGIAIEGLVLAILAEIARGDAKQNSPRIPSWLRQATEIVESRFLERLSLAAIATEVGVHYVHLSRQFHKYNQCTVGEMIRRRRVQYASHLLAHSETPLAEIALICGFADQSHLSFLFKRYMGVSPSKFRALAGRDPGAEAETFEPRDGRASESAKIAQAAGE